MDDWKNIKRDLIKNPIKELNNDSSKSDIINVFDKYGISNGEVEIWGSGNPRREFLWSEDMADACVFLLENRDFQDIFTSETTEIKNTHINIGTGLDISIKELANQIKLEIGYSGRFKFNVDKPDGTMKKLTDVSKINSLGWRHTTSMPDGIKRIYEWYLLS